MTRYDAVNYVSHGIAKRPDMNQSKTPRGVDEERDEKQQGGEGETPAEEESRTRSKPTASTSTRRRGRAASTL